MGSKRSSAREEAEQSALATVLETALSPGDAAARSANLEDSLDRFILMKIFVYTFLLLSSLLVGAQVEEAVAQETVNQETVDGFLARLATTRGAERIDLLLELTMELQRRDRYEEALRYAQETEELARELEMPEAQADALRLIGDCHHLMGATHRALEFLGRSIDLYNALALPEKAASVRKNRCSLRTGTGDYEEALNDCFRAYEFFLQVNDVNSLAGSLNNIATIYIELERNAEALEYLEEALELSEREGHRGRISRLLNNIAVIYEAQGELRLALDYLERSIEIKRELGDRPGVVRRLNNFGSVHRKMGELEKARGYLAEALSLAREIGYRRGAASALGELSELSLEEGNRPSAIEFLQQALVVWDEIGRQSLAQRGFQSLAKLYSEEGMYREAFEALRESARRQEEMVDREKTEALAKMQARFESERKQQRIEFLESEQARAALESARQRIAWYALLAGSFLVVTIILLLVHRYRQKTRAKAMAESLEREREVSTRLREVDKLRDEFLANTSHELRTPLFGITGLAESLIEGAAGPLPDSAQANLAMISVSGRRLAGLVDDLLDFSKLKHRGLELVLRPVGIHALTDIVLTMVKPLAEDKDLALVNEVDPDLPAAYADENRVHQILLNLVGNGIKFTEQGAVTVSMEQVDDELVVRVADTGIGIPTDELERIFESFEQADASIEREYGGTGLGLTVSKQLVELHGGRIWAESKPGRGANFFFTLPVATPEDLAAGAEETTEPPPVFEPRNSERIEVTGLEENPQGPLILTVDDEPVVRQVLLNHLTAAGYRLRQASSGSVALRLLEQESIDLVLLDVMMPRMSGYEVCRRIRERHLPEELPVLFLSAKEQTSDRETGLAEGANDYLLKPISKGELLLRVSTHLDLLTAHRRQKEEVKTLRGLLPICSGCKKIRDDEGYWAEIETYLVKHSEAEISHGLCFDCATRLYPGVALEADLGPTSPQE